jgi:hypothetical protein
VDTFYHVAMVRESATSCKVYLNGVLDATNVTSNAARPAATRMNIATRNAGTNPFNGLVSYGKAWTVALSAAEIASEMRSVRPLHQLNNLYAWWPMRAGATERAKDYSGRGRNWTENGTLVDEGDPPIWWGARSGFRHRVAGGVQHTQSLAGTLTGSGAIVRQIGTRVAGTLTSGGNIARIASKLMSGTLSSIVRSRSVPKPTLGQSTLRAMEPATQ